MATTDARSSFRNAVLAVLSTDRNTWPEPVIYAEAIEIDGPYPIESEIRFQACNAAAMPTVGDVVLWIYVEPESFGNLTSDHEANADDIEANLFEDAISDVLDAFILA